MRILDKLASRSFWLTVAALWLTREFAMVHPDQLIGWGTAVGVCLATWQGRKVLEKRGSAGGAP
jgi:hypothetical protein